MKKETKNLIFAIITFILPILIIKLTLYSIHNFLFLKQDIHELQPYNNGEISQIKIDDHYQTIWSSILDIQVSKTMNIRLDAFHTF